MADSPWDKCGRCGGTRIVRETPESFPVRCPACRSEHCEWCEQPAQWCYSVAGKEYLRFACGNEQHRRNVVRLLRIDNGDVIYGCMPVSQ